MKPSVHALLRLNYDRLSGLDSIFADALAWQHLEEYPRVRQVKMAYQYLLRIDFSLSFNRL